MAGTSVKSIFHVALEAMDVKGTFTALSDSTLNQHFGINHGEALPTGSFPELGYLCIGRGGHENVAGAGNLTNIRQHKINHARLFEHLPFLVRKVSDGDITDPAIRAKYALRKVENYGGEDYYVYYAKRIDLTAGDVELKQITVSGGVETVTDYVPSAEHLTPTPVSIVNGKPNTSTGTTIRVTLPVTFSLTPAEMAEIVNACEIIYGDIRYAVISEMALVSGVDKTVTSNVGGASVTYSEVIAAQCCNFLGVNTSLVDLPPTYNVTIDIGLSLPLIT